MGNLAGGNDVVLGVDAKTQDVVRVQVVETLHVRPSVSEYKRKEGKQAGRGLAGGLGVEDDADGGNVVDELASGGEEEIIAAIVAPIACR